MLVVAFGRVQRCGLDYLGDICSFEAKCAVRALVTGAGTNSLLEYCV